MQRGNRRQAHSRVSSGADYKPVAFPGYLLFDRQGVCPNSARNILEVVLRLRISPQVHTRLLVLVGSGALLRGDSGEGRPALFYLVTTAVWAGGLFGIMLCHGQNLREGLLAGVAEELIVVHTDLPRSWNGYSRILDPQLEQVQHGWKVDKATACVLQRHGRSRR